MLFPKVSSALRIRCFLSHVLSSRVSSLVFPLLRVLFLCRLSFCCLVCGVFLLLSFALFALFFFLLSVALFFSDFLVLAHFPFSLCVCLLFVLITRRFLLFFCCFSLLLCCFVVQLKPAEMGQSKTPITAVNRPIREK